VDIRREFADAFRELQEAKIVEVNGSIRLTDEGFLQIDRHLPILFEPEHRSGRYT
jgi:hypothetical protein